MSNHNSVAFRGIWLAIIVLSGLFTGVVTGMVFYVAGAQLPTAIGAAGGGFVGALTLGLTVWKFLAEGSGGVGDHSHPPAVRYHPPTPPDAQ
jgi:hypothetical protein